LKCRLIAAGTRLPEWINLGFEEYRRRLRTPLVLELQEISVATRRAGEDPKRAVHREGADMLALIGKDDFVVALDVGAKMMSTEQLSSWLSLSAVRTGLRPNAASGLTKAGRSRH
jgi:23S rRNA (pseudouridine1915-N3)-methyltransferase